MGTLYSFRNRQSYLSLQSLVQVFVFATVVFGDPCLKSQPQLTSTLCEFDTATLSSPIATGTHRRMHDLTAPKLNFRRKSPDLKSTLRLLSSGDSRDVSNEETTDVGDNARQESLFNIQTNVPVLDSSISLLRRISKGKEYLFCHICGVCRVGDGSFLLPGWMKAHSHQILRCGLSNVRYSLFSKQNSSGHLNIILQDVPRKSLNVSDSFRNMDVLGGDTPRSQDDLLLADLTPLIHVADTFKRKKKFEREIINKCFKENGAACSARDIAPEPLHPMLLLDSGVSQKEDHLWPKGIIRILRNGFEGALQVTDLQEIYGWRFRSQASCFRSLLVTNSTTADIQGDALSPENFIYSANGLSRNSVQQHPPVDGNGNCVVKVLLLNRRESGELIGEESIRKAISLFGRAINTKFSRTLVQAETVFFEDSSFHEQVSVMQEANIVVSSHGPSNANIAFLRPDTLFVELIPFGLRPRGIQDLAKAYGVQYQSFHAQPDEDTFEKCILHFNGNLGVQRTLLLQNWAQESKAFRDRTKARRINLHSTFELPDESQDPSFSNLQGIRKCASYQRISVNSMHIGKLIMEEAMRQCRISNTRLYKQILRSVG